MAFAGRMGMAPANVIIIIIIIMLRYSKSVVN